MNKKLIGLLAGTSLAFAGAAFAQSDVSPSSSSSSTSSKTVKKSEKKTEKGTGGSAMGTSSETMGNAEKGGGALVGQVIEKKGSTVYVQDQGGAVVPLKTDKSTKFEGGITLKGLKPGAEIRCSFDVRHKTENLATTIALANVGSQGMGGGSSEGSPQEEQGESPQQEQQEQMGQPSGKPSDMGSGQGGSGSQSNQPDQSNY